MDKLLFFEGGQPLHAEDIELLQESLMNTLSIITAPYGGCKLKGAVVTRSTNGETISWTDGLVLYKGRAYTVTAGTETKAQGGNIFWAFQSIEEQPETFEDGQEHRIYKRYRARPTFDPTQGEQEGLVWDLSLHSYPDLVNVSQSLLVSVEKRYGNAVSQEIKMRAFADGTVEAVGYFSSPNAISLSNGLLIAYSGGYNDWSTGVVGWGSLPTVATTAFIRTASTYKQVIVEFGSGFVVLKEMNGSFLSQFPAGGTLHFSLKFVALDSADYFFDNEL